MTTTATEAREPAAVEAAAVNTRDPFAFRFPSDFHPLREGLLVCVVIAVAVTGYLRLWRAHFRIPWAYHGDGMATLEAVKSILSSGWNLHTPRVGAPFAGSTVDFPSGGESLHWLSIKLLGYVLRSPVLTDNAYFLLGYLLVALSAYYVARYLGLQKMTALLIGVLYSFLPYHQIHGEIHLTRSAYYIVPLDVLVLLWLASWKTQLYRWEADGSLSLRRGRMAFVLGVLVVQGVSDTITSGFCICILVLLGVLLAINSRSIKPLYWGFSFAAVIGGTLLLANLPFVVARLTQGANLAALQRSLQDQDIYGMRLVFLLLPVEGHWFGPLARLTAKAHTAGEATYTEPGQALGILGGFGFLTIIACALGRSLGTPSPQTRLRSALQTLGSITLVSVLLATVGGFGFLLALFGFSDIRTWDRIVVIIGFLAYLGFALLLEQAVSSFYRRHGKGSGRSWLTRGTLTISVVGLLAVVGVADQAPPSTVPTYDANATTYDIDASFFGKLQSMVPPGSMIFQYPIMVFPENGPVHNLYDYDEFTGYIHTSTLRWSYGAIKGRTQGDWQTGTLSNLPLTTQVAALSAVGFHGIWIARNGYADHGAALEAGLSRLLGPPSLISSDQRMSYFDLAPMTARVDSSMTPAARQSFAKAVLTGIEESYNAQDFGGASYPTGTASRWADQTAHVTVTNDGSRTTAALTGVVSGNGPGRVTISGGGASTTVPLKRGSPSAVNVLLSLPRGPTTITVRATAPGPVVGAGSTGYWFQLSSVEVAPPAVHQAMCLFESGPTRPADCS
jgi:phosphoglycerol transferase